VTLTRFKNFGSGIKTAELDDLKFEIAGQEFECRPALQGFELLMFIAESSDDSTSSVESMVGLFKRVMAKKEYDRFEKLLTGKDVIIPISTLTDIAAWLIEEYTKRPTQQ
jgi:hypothetical protein